MRCCYEALGRPGGKYASLEHCPDEWKTRAVVKFDFVLCTEGFGIECLLGGAYYRPENRARYDLAVARQRVYQELLDKGKLKMHPVEVVGKRDLASVFVGLEKLKTGFVSGRRLAVVLSEEEIGVHTATSR